MAESDEAQLAFPSKNVYLQSWRLTIVIGSLCLGIFLLGLDMNIIGVAIPRITTEFKSLNDIAWYGSAYLLTITAFQPLFGNLYKYFNAKTVYLISLFLFEVGSIVCAAAPRSPILILGRALLGFGAAGLLQGALAIIGYVVPLDRVPLFQGVVVSALGIWTPNRNVPAGVCVIIVIFLFVRIQQSSNQSNRDLPLKSKLQHMDILGTILFLGAVCCLLLVLQWGGQTYPWKDSRCIGLFVGFGALTVCFCFWQWKQGERAIIPLRILRKRSICMGALVLFFLGMSSLTYAYYLPIYFQSVQGVSTVESGVRFIALVLPQIVGLVVVGGLVTRWGYYVPYMILGVVITSVGAGLLTMINISTPTVQWAAYMVINGLGIGMAQQLPYTALQAVLIALSVAIGQNLLLSKLSTSVPKHTDAVSPLQVIAAGATGLPALASTPEILYALRLAYSEGIRDTLILALAAACLAFPFSCAMEHLNIKRILGPMLAA
ncbi:MFS general substrate transporter [Whalleya microplaca]|nr:MFS general substrate transporter [Whalleya microplaca]